MGTVSSPAQLTPAPATPRAGHNEKPLQQFVVSGGVIEFTISVAGAASGVSDDWYIDFGAHLSG
jgi:hypothetical protein